MRPLTRLLRRAPTLEPALARRLDAWRQLPANDLNARFADTRYVVVDVESTGLDLNRDHLIALGAVAVEGAHIVLADSFEAVLRQEQASDKDNILVHGIGGEAQRDGDPPAQALQGFLDYLGKSPLVAFHVTFDETLIRRALLRHLGLDFRHPWVDLAYVLPGLLPEHARRHRSLDQWSGHFAITNFARHSALADALATAQLLQCVLKLASTRNAHSYRQLQALEQARRWVSWAN
ncbi:MAG TPA: 3'-5' exonuclease [Thiobacillaceae bacterium]|nr:3'-5' exonuclease [Thiobacillaceae bacterium]HNU63884.1 3'-5' exonuclease [Thiobacillaceae bacterium]